MSWRYPPPALRSHTTKSETEPSTSPLHYHAHFGTYVGLDAGVDAYRNCSGVGPFGEAGLGDVSGDNLGSVCQESEGRARPMPLAAPVITTVRPAICPFMSSAAVDITTVLRVLR